ncbi:MAG: P63C domain-containing protein [Burkholderiaceae bacterium]|nr:P63C domain-containing protein [Burkholderiaceae bacterium]
MNDEHSKERVNIGARGVSRLNAKQRSARATKAALVRAGYIATEWQGDIEIAGEKIGCAVLPDGRRILVQREVVGLLTGHKKGALARYLQPENLRPYVPAKFADGNFDETAIRLIFRGNKAHGFEGEDLVAICRMYLDARRDGVIRPDQARLALQAEAIVLSLANVGITALIDEATGYQEVRDRQALQAVLDRYLRPDLAGWTKRFPDEFFKEMFRLRGWKYPTVGAARPSVVGLYINDLVYERLAPGLLQELEERNPKTETGSRKAKHHQWLTDDTGHPALSTRLHGIMGLMRACDGWDQLMRLADRAYPKVGRTIPLMLEN